MIKQTVDIEQWDRYWAYGNIHSFSQVAGGNYEGVLADFWKQRFQGLAAGGRVVDIATGNGAIALLALEASDRLGLGLEIHGVDLADIDPGARVKDPALRESLKRINFHGRTPAERLPFDDRSVNLACSQFGLEYSDLSTAVPEVARVLAPAGRLVVVAHHRDSVLLAATGEELAQLNFVLNEARLYLRARNLLKAMAAAGRRGGPKVEKKRRALNDAMKSIRQAAEGKPNPQMLLGPARYVQEIFGAADRTAPGELLEWLEEANSRVAANQRRLEDMTAAARGESDLRTLLQQLETQGFENIRYGPLHQENGGLLAWRIEAVRA